MRTFYQADGHIWITFPELNDCTQRSPGEDESVGADGKPLLFILDARPGQRQSIVQFEQHGAKTIEETLAGRGWANAAGMAMKYPRSHLVFEIADAPAERGVIDPSAPRRAQKAALLGDDKRIIESR
ncbi:hypothetical protein X772_24915 [Mesorhizobium sp. LSJC280B00]|nr:hypothetical protein X772_24915 [Mesorhizobium sp. LSJC280B00]